MSDAYGLAGYRTPTLDAQRYGPQNYGQPVSLLIAPAAAAFGTPSRGDLIPILKLELDDSESRPVDITLSIPQTIGYLLTHPLSELVGVITWGQSRAFSDGKFPNTGVIKAEVDWLNGQVVTVSGSSVQLWARWDNWSLAGFTNPGLLDVQAFLSQRGSIHNKAPRRTQLHPDDAPLAVAQVHRPPGFAHAVKLYSRGGTIFLVECRSHGGLVLGEMTVVSGTVSPTLEIPSGTGFVAVINAGAALRPYSLVYDLAL